MGSKLIANSSYPKTAKSILHERRRNTLSKHDEWLTKTNKNIPEDELRRLLTHEGLLTSKRLHSAMEPNDVKESPFKKPARLECLDKSEGQFTPNQCNKQDVFTPNQCNNQDVFTPNQCNNQDVFTPNQCNNQDVFTPNQCNNQDVFTPNQRNNQDVFTPNQRNNQDVFTPNQRNNQDVFTPNQRNNQDVLKVTSNVVSPSELHPRNRRTKSEIKKSMVVLALKRKQLIIGRNKQMIKEQKEAEQSLSSNSRRSYSSSTVCTMKMQTWEDDHLDGNLEAKQQEEIDTKTSIKLYHESNYLRKYKENKSKPKYSQNEKRKWEIVKRSYWLEMETKLKKMDEQNEKKLAVKEPTNIEFGRWDTDNVKTSVSVISMKRNDM